MRVYALMCKDAGKELGTRAVGPSRASGIRLRNRAGSVARSEQRRVILNRARPGEGVAADTRA